MGEHNGTYWNIATAAGTPADCVYCARRGNVVQDGTLCRIKMCDKTVTNLIVFGAVLMTAPATSWPHRSIKAIASARRQVCELCVP